MRARQAACTACWSCPSPPPPLPCHPFLCGTGTSRARQSATCGSWGCPLPLPTHRCEGARAHACSRMVLPRAFVPGSGRSPCGAPVGGPSFPLPPGLGAPLGISSAGLLDARPATCPAAALTGVCCRCTPAAEQDLGAWLGISSAGLFNFKPSVRPVPLEAHIQGFPGAGPCHLPQHAARAHQSCSPALKT